MPQKHFYFPWLAPFYKQVPFARFLLWQARFLTQEGARKLAFELLSDYAEEITFERDRTRWTVSTHDKAVGMGLFLFDEFEHANTRAVLDWAHTHGRLPRGETILEIGGNIGTSTVRFLRETTCHVISIEPVPRNLALLENNLRQNGLAERVKIIEGAIADREARAEMIVQLDAPAGSELSSRFAVPRENIVRTPCEKIMVRTMRLDKLLETMQVAPTKIAFVWSDTQGSEGAVIRTGAPLWQAGVPLWAEIAPMLISRQENLNQFLTDTARFFDSYVSLTSLSTQGASAPLQPIASFNEFVARLGKAQTDVLLLPRGIAE